MVVAAAALAVERLVIALSEKRRVLAAQLQQAARDEKLFSPVPPFGLQRLRRRVRYFRQQRLPLRPIGRAAVVGIDEAQIPEVASLIDIGDAGSGQLDR